MQVNQCHNLTSKQRCHKSTIRSRKTLLARCVGQKYGSSSCPVRTHLSERTGSRAVSRTVLQHAEMLPLAAKAEIKRVSLIFTASFVNPRATDPFPVANIRQESEFLIALHICNSTQPAHCFLKCDIDGAAESGAGSVDFVMQYYVSHRPTAWYGGRSEKNALSGNRGAQVK
jgi:hypothetical protein